jgi:hypothetical protein
MTLEFEPLKITIYLKESVAFYDDYSPSIDGILEYLYFAKQGYYNSNPNPLELQQADIPLEKRYFGDDYYYACSSPHYYYLSEDQAGFRKRFDPEGIGCINWGKKRASWNSGQSEFKAFNLPLFLRNIYCLNYYVVGNKEQLEVLLADLIAVGKRHNAGWGSLTESNAVRVERVNKDYSLLGNNNELMRPIPMKYKELLPKELKSHKTMAFGWKPPARFNREVCLVPDNNVVMGNMFRLEKEDFEYWGV